VGKTELQQQLLVARAPRPNPHWPKIVLKSRRRCGMKDFGIFFESESSQKFAFSLKPTERMLLTNG
jgi:hypothetical protein